MRVNARLHRFRDQMRTGNRQQETGRKGCNKIAASRKNAKRQHSRETHSQYAAEHIGKNDEKKRGHQKASNSQQNSKIVGKRFQDVTEGVCPVKIRSTTLPVAPQSKVLNSNQVWVFSALLRLIHLVAFSPKKFQQLLSHSRRVRVKVNGKRFPLVLTCLLWFDLLFRRKSFCFSAFFLSGT
jgi:hypothetical protein